MQTSELFDIWLDRVDASDRAQLETACANESEREDAFYHDLVFGTGGLRGIIDLGPNRMNVYTVGKATQGLADYLNSHFDTPSVAIARDSRNGGEAFVRRAAEVLAANGVKAFLYPRIEPTPALSFAVRDLGCSAGICMTASHNPSKYNGYKAYGPDGCQITTQAARDIQAAIDAVDVFDDVKRMDFDQAVSAELIQWMDEGTLDRFIDEVATVGEGLAEGDLSLVYTPLNGTGLECVSRILERIGVNDVTVVPEQAVPDGNFPTCPYPNPEIREALQLGLDLCNDTHPDLLLATDPDADRVGIAVRHEGEYHLLTGNEVGILLLDFLAERAAAAGDYLSRRVAVTTIVSSAMVDAVAQGHGFQLRRTLTGFKYIGEQIGFLEAAGQKDRYLFGFEESYGYLAGTHVRDKDAVVASMLICQMARAYRAKGMDLCEAMDALYQRYGYFRNGLISIEYPGVEGAGKMAAIMAGLRSQAPTSIAGLTVTGAVDYKPGVQMPVIGPRATEDTSQTLPSADVLEFQLEGGNKVLVRPSGTEPKIKAYLFAKCDDAAQADALQATLDAAVRELLQ